MRRRLTVIQLVPALQSGGAERSALEVGRALVAAGHRSIVVSSGGRMVAPLLAQGSEHVDMPVQRKSLGSLRQVAPLRQLFADTGADIVHARSRVPAWLTWLALRRMRAPPHFVTTVHGLNRPGRYSAIMTRGERVVCVSNAVRDYVLQHYRQVDPQKLVVVPRGIDPAEFPFGHQPDDAWLKRFRAEYPQLDGAPLLTLPGRGTRLKGHADAIGLLADLRERGIEARLLLLGAREAGREAYLRELVKLARRRRVADWVVITPQRDDVRNIYAISALVLQLSNKPESFGRTVVEALSLCRPVLGYAHGGVGELLAELYPAGRVPSGDRARLVERCAELLRLAPAIEPPLSYGLAVMQQATLDIYDELAGT